MSEYGNIIKESVYAFERIARYCVYDYENVCNLFLENLRCRIYESACNHDEHFNLTRFLGLLKVLSNHKDLPEKVCQIPYYFRDFLLEYGLMPDNVMIFPQNKCTTYFIDGPNISLIPNNGIINKKAFVANATKISDNLIVTSFIENAKSFFFT